MPTSMNTGVSNDIQFQPQFGSVTINSGDYVEFALPQVELGSVATPHDFRSYGEELALCQRYYQKIDTRGTMGHCTSNNYFQTCFLFNAPMRTTPSFSIDDPNRVTQYNVTDRNVSSWGMQQFSNGSTTQVNYLIQRSTGDTLSNANSYAWNDTSVSDFYLRLDAEL